MSAGRQTVLPVSQRLVSSAIERDAPGKIVAKTPRGWLVARHQTAPMAIVNGSTLQMLQYVVLYYTR